MTLRNLARRLPAPVYRALRAVYRRLAGPSSSVAVLPEPGPLLLDVVPRLAAIPGWFNLDDLAHFTLVLNTQSAAGLHGDIIEIGCYHGRSAALLAMHLEAGERLTLVDVFDLPTDEPYGDTPTVEGVRRNLHQAVPGIRDDQVDIIRARSADLRLPAGQRFRFAHVDGGHSKTVASGDLELCAEHLIAGGVIVVDDYAHPDHPGVTTAVNEFLAANGQFVVLADLNRRGARGRKLYMARRR